MSEFWNLVEVIPLRTGEKEAIGMVAIWRHRLTGKERRVRFDGRDMRYVNEVRPAR